MSTNITRPNPATLTTIPGISPWDLNRIQLTYPGGSASYLHFESPFCKNTRVSLRPTEVLADPEGRLWVARRKRSDRPDGGKLVHLQPVLCYVVVYGPGVPPWYREMRTEAVHLQAAESLEAIALRAQELVDKVEADPAYLLQRRAADLALALQRKHAEEQQAADLAELRRKVQEAEAWLASKGQELPELKMLRSQPRKGQRWLEAWKRALLPLLRPFGLGGRPADDLALRLGKELF